MKKLILLSLLFMTSMIASAQSYHFYSNEGMIYWQMVYEADVDIISMLTNSGKFDQINKAPGIVSAQLTPNKVNLNGRRNGSVPIYISQSNMSGFVRIQQKDGRYRVTVDQIVFSNNNSSLGQIGEETPLETYALKRDGSFKPIFLSTAAEILDEALTETFRPQEDLGDDW